MSVEATFYTLQYPLPEALLSSMSRAPGVESLERIPQEELHEHLVGFLGFITAVTEGRDDDRTIALVSYVLSIGDAIDFKFEASPVGDAAQLRIREQLSAFGGLWLIAEGVFDTDGRMILGHEAEKHNDAQIPEVPESRLTAAQFLYGALENERELEDEGEEPSPARLLERPLHECYRMIEFGRRKAESYGLTDLSDQFAFVSLMLEIGPNFDDHPEIRSILSDPSVPASERLTSCIEHEDAERIWTEAEAMVDHDLWSAATPH